jgi:hypothetical protein
VTIDAVPLSDHWRAREVLRPTYVVEFWSVDATLDEAWRLHGAGSALEAIDWAARFGRDRATFVFVETLTTERRELTLVHHRPRA